MVSAALFTVLSLNSCADDLEVRSSLQGDTFDPSALTIYIPDVESAAEYGRTRAESTVGLADADEAAIKKLSFFAYPVTEDGTTANDGREPIIVIGMTPSENGSMVFRYTRYDIKGFQAGHYKFYLVANFDRYLPSGTSLSTSIPESDLLNIVLNFANTTDKYLVSGELPMACLNNEFKTGESDDTKITTGIYKFEGTSGTSKSLYADLTFLCSKVRYTILFDKNESGNTFSSYDVDFTGVVANNVRQQYAWANGTANNEVHNSFSLFARNHTKVAYPETGSKYLTGLSTSGENNDQYVKDLDRISLASEWKSQEQRAWQGTIYLPVNANPSKKTSLHFTASGSGVSDEGYDLTFDELAKGKFYDAVAHLQTSQSVSLSTEVTVIPWSSQTLQYALHGPIELIVSDTKIEVGSGAPFTMSFFTDVPLSSVSFQAPHLKGDSSQPQFYVGEILKNDDGSYLLDDEGNYQLEVKINPLISFTILNDVDKSQNGYNRSDYNYFEIIAGNIRKRIKVDPLTLKGYLTVSPNEILLDVRSYVTSGKGSNKLLVDFETNITNSTGITYTIVDEDGNTVSNSTLLNTSAALYFKGEDDVNMTETALTNSWEGQFSVNLAKLFDGDSFWKTPRTYYITFTATSDDGSTTDTDTLQITVKPYTTDYVIHFRCSDPNHKWDNPHGYIYQCLTLPMGLSTNSQYSGMTVGYYDGTTTNDDPKAGLEYMFSNNIAFKGWLGYGGSVNPEASGTTFKDGFVFVGGYQYKTSPFNPQSYSTTESNNYYKYDVDFNSTHAINQSNWACLSCMNFTTPVTYNTSNGLTSGTIGNRLFAGISFEKEYGDNEGWYKYTLSGVATPGKCLIIFFNGHIWNDLPGEGDSGKQGYEKYYRYPTKDKGKDTAGVPLFDFPDNEGWFIFDGNAENNRNQNFTDDPEALYRFYWPLSCGNAVHVWTNTSTANDASGKDITTWEQAWGHYDSSLGYYYIDFPRKYSNYFFYKVGTNFENMSADKYAGSMSTFKWDGMNYSAYVTSSNSSIIGGKPPKANVTSTQFNPEDIITVKWYSYKNSTYMRYAYVFGGPGELFGKWTGKEVSPANISQTNELTWKVSSVYSNANVIINNNGNIQVGYLLSPTSVNIVDSDTKNFTAPTASRSVVTLSGNRKHYTYTLWTN